MKKIVLICLTVLCMYNSLNAQNYYWYKGNKQPLEIVEKQQYVLVESSADAYDLASKMALANIKSDFKKLCLSSSLKEKESGKYWSIISLPDQIKKYDDSVIVYTTPLFLTEKKTLVGISQLFYVKLNTVEGINHLEKLSKENNVTILGNNQYMPLWYTLSCSKKSTGNALEMANLFYESGLFADAIPDILVDDYLDCVNDTYFSDQWGLKNTGQNNGTVGVDINYCDVLPITNGSANIIVAVLDQGVELNHPDLTNMYSLSFDTENGTSPSIVRGVHATACAGIIGADADNNIGIAGIAPSCPIMSISNSLSGTPDSRMKRADGINFAWINGASVISNSWGSSVQYPVIDDAINNAAMNGRNGKGCVIVFASGNEYSSSVSYPACLPNVISAGSINSSGQKANYSNYGTALDVVAPGVNISTTDCQGNYGYNISSSANEYANRDYTCLFGGTSAACPHVSGVAALVLSVNPDLTAQQVRDIIETTAQKVGGYTYGTDNIHPNGTWNNQVGYGLVDAYAAVQKAMNYTNDLYIRDTVTDNGSMPSPAAYTWNSPDIWIEDTLGHYVPHPHGNAWYNVCVRIHNRRDVASSGTERLFLNWSKAGLYDKWNKYWTGDYLMPCGAPHGGVIGRAEGKLIPSIPAHGSIIDTIRWHTPAGEAYECCTDFNYDQWHFCLLARIHDDDEIAHENEQETDLAPMVRNHNNVAQQNVYLDSAENYQKVLGIGNATATIKARLICLSPKVIEGVSITDYAEVYITLDAGLLAALNSSNISGMEWVNGNTLRWTGGSACIPVTLPANSNYTLMTTVRFLADQTPATGNFDFDIVLRSAVGDSILGGEHYRCIPPEGCGFDPVVSATPGVDMIAFNVVEEDEYALYEVTDMYGNSVSYTSGNITVCPAESGCYTICVTTLDGCTECRTLCVTLPDAMLSSIYPNPADGEVNIDYQLSRRISGGTIQIISANGVKMYSQTVTNTTKGKTMKGSLKLSTAAYAPGQYIVRILSSKGEVYDSKTLIVK